VSPARILGDVNFELSNDPARPGFEVKGWYWDEGNSKLVETTDFANHAKDLRSIEVIVRYRIADDAGWSNIFTKSIKVAPRTLTLAGY
jgi:hypothetical protein